MTKRRRVVCLVLVCLLIVMASITLTGCSKNPNQDSEKGRWHAMIRMPDGSIVGGPVTNYSIAGYSETVTLDIDGIRYKTQLSNVVMTRELSK